MTCTIKEYEKNRKDTVHTKHYLFRIRSLYRQPFKLKINVPRIRHMKESTMSALSVDTICLNWVLSALASLAGKRKTYSRKSEGGGGWCNWCSCEETRVNNTSNKAEHPPQARQQRLNRLELDHYYFLYSKWSIFLATTIHDSPGPAEVWDFLFWLVIFFGLVVLLKL